MPTFICVRGKKKAHIIDKVLKELDFVYDGLAITSPHFLECIGSSRDYSFPKYRSGKIKSIPSPQFVHRTGALFIRKIIDRHGNVILAGIENYRHASNENMFREITRKVVSDLIDSIKKADPSKESA